MSESGQRVSGSAGQRVSGSAGQRVSGEIQANPLKMSSLIDTGGGGEDEDGNLYSEPALQQMFGAKFATQSGGTSDQTAAGSEDDGQQEQISQTKQYPKAK
jgi:hypothetical protein